MAQALDPRVAALLEQTAAPGRLLSDAVEGAAGGTPTPPCSSSRTCTGPTTRRSTSSSTWVAASRCCAPCWCLSLRTDEIGADHPLAQVLGDLPSDGDDAHRAASRCRPRRSRCWREQAGHSGADLHRITAGNPFFVTELLAGSEAEPGAHSALRYATRCGRGLRACRQPSARCWRSISIVPGSVERWLAAGAAGRRCRRRRRQVRRARHAACATSQGA